MSILSLYSKIQLKIGKAEEKLAGERSDKRSDSGVCYLLKFRKLTHSAPLRVSLLFYKTLKTIVRFFALLFNDSSENYLMFASEAKGWLHSGEDSPLERGRGVLKKFQKRVRFYSKTAFAGILNSVDTIAKIAYKKSRRKFMYNFSKNG